MRLPRDNLEHAICDSRNSDNRISGTECEGTLVIGLDVRNLERIGHDLSPNKLKTKHMCSLIHVSNIGVKPIDIGYYLFM
jgi:hypothetical protein